MEEELRERDSHVREGKGDYKRVWEGTAKVLLDRVGDKGSATERNHDEGNLYIPQRGGEHGALNRTRYYDGNVTLRELGTGGPDRNRAGLWINSMISGCHTLVEST